jgi:hypothetical protein
MALIVFPTKIEAETKAKLQAAAAILNMSTNALASKLLEEGALKIINSQYEGGINAKPGI